MSLRTLKALMLKRGVIAGTSARFAVANILLPPLLLYSFIASKETR